jgi:hypothetical protein
MSSMIAALLCLLGIQIIALSGTSDSRSIIVILMLGFSAIIVLLMHIVNILREQSK